MLKREHLVSSETKEQKNKKKNGVNVEKKNGKNKKEKLFHSRFIF
jgi:hypothetical protein